MMTDANNIERNSTEAILQEYYIPNPEETVAIASIEQFLFDSATFDVWNSQSALNEDYLVVIEFSEIEGPKAWRTFPDVCQSHFDSSEMALRLMTADYQGNGRGPFSVPVDTTLLLTNEEQGVHAFVYHFSLFDLEARGYIRPYCIAYCSDDWSKVFQLFDKLKNDIHDVTESLKACNMRLMCKELSEAIDFLQNLEARAVSNYYEITYTEHKFGQQKTPEAQNLKAMRLRRDLEAVYSIIAGQGKLTGSPRHCTETHKNSDVETWIHWFIESSGSRNEFRQMKTLLELCPCICQIAMQRLNRILETYADFSPLNNLYFDGETPAVLVGKMPLLFVPEEKFATKLKSAEKNDFLKIFEVNNDDSSNDDKVLHSISGALPHVLFPILSGRTLIVGGGETRRKIVMQMVRVLAKFIPSAPQRDRQANFNCWHDGPLTAPDFTNSIVGCRITNKLADLISKKFLSCCAQIDLNKDFFSGPQYTGTIFNRISAISSFHSKDRSLISFLFGLLGDFSLNSLVLFHFLFADVETYRKNAKYFKSFARKLGLEKSDLKIVRNLIELIKIALDDGPTQLTSTHEKLVLETESFRTIKL